MPLTASAGQRSAVVCRPNLLTLEIAIATTRMRDKESAQSQERGGVPVLCKPIFSGPQMTLTVSAWRSSAAVCNFVQIS